MNFYEIAAVRDYLRQFSRIRHAERIDDNVVRLVFTKEVAVAFDLSRGGADIFAADRFQNARRYRAPFDTLLKKRLTNATLIDVATPGDDKILELTVRQESAYKAIITVLRLELAGRYTNAILLDENGVVLEALRHTDEETDRRVVRPGAKLAPLPPYLGPRRSGSVQNVPLWLAQRAQRRRERRLRELKNRHAKPLQRKIEKLQKLLRNLPDPQTLQQEARRYETYGNLVLANLHKIRPYDTRLETEDFEGRPVTVDLPDLPNPRRIGEYFFNRARRAANKAANLHIEKENLQSRIAFYKHLLESLQKARKEEEITLLFPPRQRHREKKAHKRLPCETFELDENWRLLVGRNEQENVWLLKNARAADLWLHLKDRPSGHCIIPNPSRRQIPRDIVQKAARICVETATTQPGSYPVDFTFRRNVKIVRGAHVQYVNYDTVYVKKE